MPKIGLSRQKFAPFKRPIRVLRAALGETQEGMAKRLGMSFHGYIKWERGISAPRSSQLEKILALCPDVESRADFGLQIADAVGQNARAAAPQPKSPEDVKKLRARTMAIQAIQVLYEAALDGAPGAEEKLVAMADSLLESAGKYDRAKPRGK